MAKLHERRPARTYTTGAVTKWLRWLALLGFVAVTVWVALSYASMLDTVPTHFGLDGQADGFGEKSSVLWLAAVMTGLGLLMAWLSTKPRHLNYVSEITEQNAQHVYREGERMLVWMMLPLLGVYCSFVLGALGFESVWLVVLSLIALPVLTITSLARMGAASSKKAEADPDS